MRRLELQGLPWLPLPPADFQTKCKTIGLDGKSLRALSNFSLNDNELNRLKKALVRERENNGGGEIRGLKSYRLGVVSNGTTKLFTSALIGTAARHGINLTLVEGEFDQAFYEATDPASRLRNECLDGILVALDHRGLPGLYAGIDEDESRAVDDALNHMRTILQGLRESGAALFVQNIPCPFPALFGSLDARLNGSQRRRIERFNLALNDLLSEFTAILVDIDGLVRTVGYENWFDPKQWHMAKLPFSQDFVPLYTDYLSRLIGALNGLSRKCLVLDLDNTLWGGVVGDDGVHGLNLGQGDALGEAFVAVQQTAKMLRQRGVILAICSKNTESVARAAFRDHPDMVLKEEDISVFQANWQDKASNLEAIARTLNIGTDALVFVDDNPAEREQIRQALPEVAVPELTDDPSDYPFLILAGGYFESASFTEEDRQRAGHYQANAARAQLAESSRDLGEYLSSLEMVIRFSPFDETGRSRISQLTHRSNQFNLTTRRYDDAAIAAFEKNDDAFTLQIRLADRFGDNGMISVVICNTAGTDWEIDTWLMSCRVLNRRVEEAILDVLATNAKRRGISRLVGFYIPSEKNAMVRSHYSKLGFVSAESRDDSEIWHLDLTSYLPKQPPMQFSMAEGLLSV